MDSLTSRSLKILFNKFGDGAGSCLSPLGEDVVARAHVRFPRVQKLADFGFFRLASGQHKLVGPIPSLSSNIEHPLLQADLETAEDEATETYSSRKVHVRFQLQRECQFGEQFLVVGDDPALGSWDPSSAVSLDWSDGHIWSVELDIPTGRDIRFKFILRQRDGEILWQPDPDRILQILDTDKTITIYEDWENAELRKITEEELSDSLSEAEVPTYGSERLIGVENSDQWEEKVKLEASNRSAFAGNCAAPEESPLVEAHDDLSFPETVGPVEDMPVALYADNILQKQEQSSKDATNNVHCEKRIGYQNEDLTMSHKVFGNSGRATVDNSTNMNFQSDLVVDEVPVLVPGFTPLSMVLTEESNRCEEVRSSAGDASGGPDDAITSKLPEQEHGCNTTQEETALIFGEGKLDNQHEQIIHIDNREGKTDHETSHNVLRDDIRWGHRTLQKFLATLGLL
ncbi:CBM20 domain-containing protein [Psidium guajava]|nr:CBM20 domain-containing protein [Psidium guajava]